MDKLGGGPIEYDGGDDSNSVNMAEGGVRVVDPQFEVAQQAMAVVARKIESLIP